MIDVRTEQLIILSQLVRRLPARRNQRPVHPATAHRWRKPGLHGVRLECIRVGGIWHTSMEAFQRFCDRLTSLDDEPMPSSLKTASVSKGVAESSRREHVERELNQFGI